MKREREEFEKIHVSMTNVGRSFFFFGLALAGIMRSRFPEDGNFDFSL
jgi:hypothetical protein